MKNILIILFMSIGIPMLVFGIETRTEQQLNIIYWICISILGIYTISILWRNKK